MQIDTSTTDPRDTYKHMIACILPRPIAWVSTLSPNGIANLAPFSFFTAVSANPPVHRPRYRLWAGRSRRSRD